MEPIHTAKRRRLSPPEGEQQSRSRKGSHKAAFLANAATWNLEQGYETKPRKLKKQKESKRLPIMTMNGWVAPALTAPEEKIEESDSASMSEREGDEQKQTVDKIANDQEPEIPIRQQILEAKEELARLASLINEDPEEHAGALKALAVIADSEIITIKKLALATQMTVYKDLIPGYRIRPLSEEKMQDKISKEVRKLRVFEQKLVSGYEAYIKSLSKLAKSSGSDGEQIASLASVAVGCACNLVTAVPHFNFRGELLKILVGILSIRRAGDNFETCKKAIETLFENDEDGNASLEAVTMLTKMMKSRNYHFDERVLNTFLHLRLLSEFANKASYYAVDKGGDQQVNGKRIKPKREFRTKKLRKELKEKKQIEKEFQEADAAVSHEERDKMQAETLKMVFVAYFRILKARSPKLMGAVLEGLARYAHLINQDFFGDILEALRDIISTAELSAAAEVSDDEDAELSDSEELPDRNVTRESLLCVITAFALLEGQDQAKAASTLKLDLGFFIAHLYRTLHPVSLHPDIELSSRSIHLPDPRNGLSHRDTTKINVQTTIVLLIRSLTSVLLPAASIRSVPPVRIAAFAKQLMTVSLHLPEKSSIAILGLLNQVSKVHGKKVAPLWSTEERRGDGVFNALTSEIEGSNPFSATIWESELLRWHYAPGVREALNGIEKNIKDGVK